MRRSIVSFDLLLLGAFVEPATIYAVHENRGIGYYSGVHKAVWRHARLGLLRISHVEVSEKNGTKKFWVLTEKGRALLELFSAESKEESV